MSPHEHGDDCGYYRHCAQCGYPLIVHRNKTDPCAAAIELLDS